jgi:hypothetical protein
LLFAKVHELDEVDKKGNVQVLYVDSPGPETGPPSNASVAASLNQKDVDFAKPVILRTTPTVFRKWPIDLEVVEYEWPVERTTPAKARDGASGDGVEGEQRSRLSKYDCPTKDLERPLSWNGARYFLEALLDELDPIIYERRFRGYSLGLFALPELDRESLKKEFKRRAAERREFLDREPGWYARVKLAEEALTAEIATERRHGWFARGFEILDRKKTELETWKERWQQSLLKNVDKLARVEPELLEKRLEKTYEEQKIRNTQALARLIVQRKHLETIVETYPELEGEKAFNAEIKRCGEAHLAWAARQRETLKKWLDRILAQDLWAALPAAIWDELEATLAQAKTTYWHTGLEDEIPTLFECNLSHVVQAKNHLSAAIREDALDLYVRNSVNKPVFPKGVQEKFEYWLRLLDYYPHLMGGKPHRVQSEAGADDPPLLFAIGSDAAMNWLWGDEGAIYVELPEIDLNRNRFDAVHTWLEGH